MNKVSALSLLFNAVLVWNTVRIAEIVRDLERSVDRPVRPDVHLLAAAVIRSIVSRRVVDLDEDNAPGDLLWIPCSKTPAGRRTLAVPGALRPLLLSCVEGKASERYIFERERPHEFGSGKPHFRD